MEERKKAVVEEEEAEMLESIFCLKIFFVI